MSTLLPRAVAERLAIFRRDVAMLRDSLAGRSPTPCVPRSSTRLVADAAPRASTPQLLAARTLRITRVVRETPDAVSLSLVDDEGDPIAFEAGQFFTVLAPVEGEVLRRAYSATTSALETRAVALAVKRVKDGRVSNWINDHAREGMTLDVLGPSGSFCVPRGTKHVVLLAGGSGITPMMSIAKTLLATDPEARVTLVYGNRGEADVIFRAELEAITREHAARMVVRHVLEQPPAGWVGGTGRLDAAGCAAALDALTVDSEARFFVCGPEPMMNECRAALLARGVDASRIHEERFTAPQRRRAAPSDDAIAPRVVTVRNKTRAPATLTVAPGQTLLEAGLAAGEPMPYSCAMGGCAACKVRLVSGEVAMDEPNCLTDEERAEGYVLACVSRPRGACVVEVP